MKIGANYKGNNNCEFVVWAPFLNKVELKIVHPYEKIIEMEKDEAGYWCVKSNDIPPGTRYFFRLEGNADRPDPGSCYQPETVHGPSEVIDHGSFKWEDVSWHNMPLANMIMYEIHTGTYTPEGTFEAIIPKLDYLIDLGVNTIELMPITQFPGDRNWGYDGVYPYSVQNSYGGPEGLKKLVNECHKKGIAVILDTVYNHMGPEGNYFREYGPYFTPQYKTPWGDALNFDHEYCDEVRNYFFLNAVHWFKNYHIDGLRLDAVDRILDMGARHFLQQLKDITESVSQETGKKLYLIVETAANDTRMLKKKELNGYGMDAQWLDDFHHTFHTFLTGESAGYYIDYGKMSQLVKAIREGYVYSWQYSKLRKKHYGSSSREIPASQFVVFTQNHDHVGNRMLGERLNSLIPFPAMKLVAALVIHSPYIPILFMGEEFGETNPFLFFVSHSEPELIEAVRKGRSDEFKHFEWADQTPDPESEETFLRSKIDWNKLNYQEHRVMLEYYKQLLYLRREIPALRNLDKNNLHLFGKESENLFIIHRWYLRSHTAAFFNLNDEEKEIYAMLPEGRWEKVIDSSDTKWNGEGTILPDKIDKEGYLSLKPWNYALYIMK